MSSPLPFMPRRPNPSTTERDTWPTVISTTYLTRMRRNITELRLAQLALGIYVFGGDIIQAVT